MTWNSDFDQVVPLRSVLGAVLYNTNSSSYMCSSMFGWYLFITEHAFYDLDLMMSARTSEKRHTAYPHRDELEGEEPDGFKHTSEFHMSVLPSQRATWTGLFQSCGLCCMSFWNVFGVWHKKKWFFKKITDALSWTKCFISLSHDHHHLWQCLVMSQTTYKAGWLAVPQDG